MAVYDQPKTTYSDTLAQKRVISDAIFMVDPKDTPAIFALGGLDAGRQKFNIRMNGTKVELLEDEYDPLTTTANSTTLTAATTVTNFTVADASIFQDGHVILIDSEYMVVSAVDATNNTITVYSRSYGGTNATHLTTATIEIVGMARLEGDDADYGPVVTLTNPYNYSGIFQKAIKMSGTERAIDQYGFTDAFVYQSNKRVPHLLRLLDKAIFHGVRAAGSATTPRSFGGLGTFVTNNSVDAGGAIAKSDLDNLAEAIYLDGGAPDILFVHPSVSNDIRGLIDTSSFVRVGQENTMLGMAALGTVNTQYGAVAIVQDRFMPLSKAWMVDSRKVGLITVRPFEAYALAKTGDSDKGEVVGEFSLLVANDKAHGWIYGITS